MCEWILGAVDTKCHPLLISYILCDICVSVNADVEKQKVEQVENLQEELSNAQNTNMPQDAMTAAWWIFFTCFTYLRECSWRNSHTSSQKMYYLLSKAVQTVLILQKGLSVHWFINFFPVVVHMPMFTVLAEHKWIKSKRYKTTHSEFQFLFVHIIQNLQYVHQNFKWRQKYNQHSVNSKM